MGGGFNPFAGGAGGAGGFPGGATFSFSSGGGPGGGFTPSDPNDIFSALFGSLGGGMGGGMPGGGGGARRSRGGPGANPFASMGGMGGMGGGGGFPGGFGGMDIDSDEDFAHAGQKRAPPPPEIGASCLSFAWAHAISY